MSSNNIYKVPEYEYKWGEDELTVDVGITAQEIDSMLTSSITSSIGASGSYYVSNGTGGTTWNTNPYVFSTNGMNIGNVSGAGLHVTSDAEFDGDIKWKGRSLGEMLSTIEKRLAILTPDPAKLEHFEALQKAYQHYKTLEALCELPIKEEE